MGIEKRIIWWNFLWNGKMFLTKGAEQYNDSKKPVSSANLAYLQAFWGKPVIIESLTVITGLSLNNKKRKINSFYLSF